MRLACWISMLIPRLVPSQVFEPKLPAAVGRTQRREKPDIGNGVRSAYPRRRQNSRYQVHAKGHSGPD